MKSVLTIAGSDPSGGAGVQRDLKVFTEFGCNGLSVITALTAQNSKIVKGVVPVSGLFVKRQIEALLEEYTVGAVKTGMLATDEIVRTLVMFFRKHSDIKKNLVIDPVITSTSGYLLLEKKGIARFKDE